VELFREIEEKSEFYFFYQKDDLKELDKVTVNVKNATVTEILDKALVGYNLDYKVVDRYIIVRKTGDTFGENIMAAQQQQRTISGKVTDSSEQPLPGVSVVVKGTTQGTVTNPDGDYSIGNVPANAVLQFSFVGMKSQEVVVGSQTSINVVMEEDAIGIEEVVAIGYGTQSKRNITTSISTIGNEKIASMPVSNAAQALVGQIAGVQLKQNSGQPGVAPSIRIRGNGSITSGNSPLYVIDGFPLSDAAQFNSISPNQIESIDILKDAASAAIYGSRAGNGVIIVTTKKGKVGKTKFTFDTSFGFDELSKKIDVLNPEEYAEMAIEALTNQGKPIPEYFTNKSMWTRTDWQDVIFRTAPVQNHQIGANGGNENIRFNVSFGYLNQQGILENSYMKRYNLHMGFDAKLNRFLNIGASVLPSYTEDRIQNPQGPNNTTDVAGVVAEALSLAPILPVWKENGDYFVAFQDPIAKSVFNDQITNPLNKLDANKDFYKTYRQTANAYIELQPTKGLSIRSTFNSAITARKRDFYVEAFLARGGTNTGNISTPNLAQIRAERTNATGLSWYLSNTATYDYSFNDTHFLTALIGYDVSQQDNFSVGVSPRTDKDNPVAFDNTTITNVQGAILRTGTSLQEKYAFDAIFGRLNYNYNNKYLFSASIRRDRSSRFGPNNRAGIFPSVSGAWNISEEEFIKNQHLISALKIRASYGETGNDQLSGNYPWLSTMSKNNYVFGANGNDVRVQSYYPNGFSNRNLGWEKNKQVDIGVDMGIFKGRVNIALDVYERNSNTILSASIPIINGKSGTVIQNVGNVKNKGIEFTLDSKNLTGVMKWETNFNISFNRNKITELGLGQNQLGNATAGTFWANVVRNYVGRPMGDLYMYVVEGTFNNEEDLAKYAKNGTQGIGDLRFEDVNGDKKITTDDMKLVGNYQPDFIFGLSNKFTYKGFDLSILLDCSYGGEIINAIGRPISLGRELENAQSTALGRWKSESDPGSGLFHKAGTTNLGSNIGPNTRFLYDASFLRIRNITLGYSVHEDIVQKIGSQDVRLYITTQNLHTFTKFPGYNPEGNYGGDNATVNGVDQGSYPLARNFTFGINISF
jgi:TonB-linked SusC/RagA family outer membrane protein